MKKTQKQLILGLVAVIAVAAIGFYKINSIKKHAKSELGDNYSQSNESIQNLIKQEQASQKNITRQIAKARRSNTKHVKNKQNELDLILRKYSAFLLSKKNAELSTRNLRGRAKNRGILNKGISRNIFTKSVNIEFLITYQALLSFMNDIAKTKSAIVISDYKMQVERRNSQTALRAEFKILY